MVAYGDVLRAELGVDPQSKEEWIEVLRQHGDIEDAKTNLLFILDEEEIELEAEDIEAVTDEPPNATFT